jgi:hypothetical protein
MPKWRRSFHRIATGFMCLLFCGLVALGARILLAATRQPNKSMLVFGLLFMAMAAVAAGMQFWFLRRMISEFSFDGCLLQFRTLGVTQTQTRAASDLSEIREWRGRGGPLGYRLTFRDGEKAYLEFYVSNAQVAAQLLSQVAGA